MQRHLFDELLSWRNKAKRKPLILQGARQVGKTHLLKQFANQCFPNSFYINFENQQQFHKLFEKNLDPKRIIKEISFEFDRDVNIDTDFLIFDEIQACPAAITSLKYFNEETPRLAVAAAGSLLGVHLGDSSFPVGKVDMLKLSPINFSEFLQALEQKQLLELLNNHDWSKPVPEMAHQRFIDLLKQFMVIGGMPEVITQFIQFQEQPVRALDEVRIKQTELIHAYNSDIAKHAGKANAMHIARVWEQAALQLAHTQNETAERFRFKDIIPGVDRYQLLVNAIDWLEKANLIFKIPIAHTAEIPLKAYTKESLFKMLYFDIGLLGARTELPAKSIVSADYGGFKGYMSENFIAQELHSIDVHSMNHLYTWQENKAEIEFLQTTKNGIVPLEVKAGKNTKSRSLEKYLEKYKPARAVILSANNIDYDKSKKIYYCPLYLAALQPWLSIS